MEVFHTLRSNSSPASPSSAPPSRPPSRFPSLLEEEGEREAIVDEEASFSSSPSSSSLPSFLLTPYDRLRYVTLMIRYCPQGLYDYLR
ncbi:hypothetical protein Naga_102358g1 [Nannochloropsis gaditana]|uniref:Uncharacterized protein n=1 Tax=Nannochloropsis gaditana TaxID=72520 RepID=W7TX97_9STRA|nr:hypothetical protein Naga_102358g1 [Nannochloropsis gaditana]